MRIGVIADDFTGATDAASFIVRAGLSAIQVSTVPGEKLESESDAIIVSLKSRSCPSDEAVRLSLSACEWLQQQGCTHIYFKYCSTFDSTESGNIGPVTEALMRKLGVKSTVVCPALPVNGRTVYQGHLFVFDQLLSDSGMRNHPITPMRDSSLIRLMEAQSPGKAGLIALPEIRQGAEACELQMDQLSLQGVNYIVCDAIDDNDLTTIGMAAKTHKLGTGGSGFVGAIAKALNGEARERENSAGIVPGHKAKGIILSGSCSLMTNSQVDFYKEQAPALKLEVSRCISDAGYIDEVFSWVINHSDQLLFPMVYATVAATELKQIQDAYGMKASESVETLFNALTRKLYENGYNTIISAGGETSGTVTQALAIEQFRIGREIAPGVPWVTDLNNEVYLALKSGNFGQEKFFLQAQELTK